MDTLIACLRHNTDLPFADECLSALLTKKVLVRETPTVLETKHAYEVYTTRYGIQKEVTPANVEGYEFLLDNLALVKESSINLLSIIVEEQLTYIIFCDQCVESVIGILKSPYINKAWLEQVKAGLIDSSLVAYDNGKRI